MRASFSLNPLMSREIRSRWRDKRAFGLIFLLVTVFSGLLVAIYNETSTPPSQIVPTSHWAMVGHTVFSQLAWVQTVGWLLIAPSLTSSSIAYERERGWLDALLLSPLLPRQIALGKWGAALLFAAILYAVTLPFVALTLLFGGVSPAEFLLTLVLHALCAGFGAAVGLAASAWSFRSSAALRSAYGLIFLWLVASFMAAGASGAIAIGRFRAPGISSSPAIYDWIGQTNPILCAIELVSLGQDSNWPMCFGFLSAMTLLLLWRTTNWLRKPLEDAPLIELKRRTKEKPGATHGGTQNGTHSATHGEIPWVSRLKFSNPILDREVRSKFRMRKPPWIVVAVEIVLGILVAGFYVRTFFWALFSPDLRPLIWWGLVFTGLIVTMIACAVMGANGLSREREKGTWEGIRLSLLSPNEILRGKATGSVLTCLLFSLPVWPLLLPCVNWSGAFSAVSGTDDIGPGEAIACGFIWLATAWSYTCIGLWVGKSQARSSRASAQTLLLLTGYLVATPVVSALFFFDLSGTGSDWLSVLAVVHPLLALAWVTDGDSTNWFSGLALPYLFFNLALGAALLKWIKMSLKSELGRSSWH